MDLSHQPLKFWKSPEERNRAALTEDDGRTHPLERPDQYSNRRDFLRAAGFSIAGAAMASCSRAPVEQAIPLLVQPENQVAGRAYFYTSVCSSCAAGCGVVVKTVDGRPVKLEGNPAHPLSRGGLCAVGQASLLGLYDSHRFAAPLDRRSVATWQSVDDAVRQRLDGIRKDGGAVRVVTGPLLSPTLRTALQGFLGTLPNARLVTYDPLSNAAWLDAHERTHGVRAAPRVHLERADVIVALDADFLGTWIAPVPFAAAYREGRALEQRPRTLSFHAQLESRMSLSGTRADQRLRLAPHELMQAAEWLYARISALAGHLPVATPPLSPDLARDLDALAHRLWDRRGKSVVLCGIQDVDTQVVCNATNHLLGAYGTVLDLDRPSHQVQGSDRDLEALLHEIEQGQVAALFIHGVNPAYDAPLGSKVADALARVPLIVSLAQRPDETTALATYVCPVPHPLESWGDAEPVTGMLSVQQPTVAPFGKTRPAEESFTLWAGGTGNGRDLVRAHWEAHVFPRQQGFSAFAEFWDHALREGVVEVDPERLSLHAFDAGAVHMSSDRPPPAPDRLALVLYPKVGLLDGRHAYNAWLQELPDPVTKVTWDNYASLSVATARRLGLQDGDMVRLTPDGPGDHVGDGGSARAVDLPAYVQPGQHDGVVAVALGYGSVLSARFTDVGPAWTGARPTVGQNGRVGVNAAPLLTLNNGVLSGARRTVRLSRLGAVSELASTQTHFNLTTASNLGLRQSEEVVAIRETTLSALNAGHAFAAPHPSTPHADLWPADHPYPGHKWGLVIDLNTCTGCSACVIACQAENNSPVVGKDEVRRSREMHWLRLDRYYTGEDDAVRVAVQPMLCQHCENAPCETVCPVAATVHDDEGLNVQVYNRCVGTRFCENNCPYKVRRFNWFEYQRNDRVQNLALNPGVTVRSRGVMEKCTFCTQRIQEAELEARRLGIPLSDGGIQTACQQSCPSRAITFGDVNDPKSRVAALRESDRHYRVLEDLNVKPSVGYLAAVRNREEA